MLPLAVVVMVMNMIESDCVHISKRMRESAHIFLSLALLPDVSGLICDFPKK